MTTFTTYLSKLKYFGMPVIKLDDKTLNNIINNFQNTFLEFGVRLNLKSSAVFARSPDLNVLKELL